MGLLDTLALRIATTATRGVGLFKSGADELQEQEEERRRRLRERVKSGTKTAIKKGKEQSRVTSPALRSMNRDVGKVANMAKTIAQDTARYTAGLGVGLSRAAFNVAGIKNDIPEEIPTKSTRTGRIVFGGRPVPFTVQKTAKSNVEDFGGSEATAERYSRGKFALPIAVAGTAMNLIPGGKGAKGLKAVSKFDFSPVIRNADDLGSLRDFADLIFDKNFKVTKDFGDRLVTDAKDIAQRYGIDPNQSDKTLARIFSEIVEAGGKIPDKYRKLLPKHQIAGKPIPIRGERGLLMGSKGTAKDVPLPTSQAGFFQPDSYIPKSLRRRLGLPDPQDPADILSAARQSESSAIGLDLSQPKYTEFQEASKHINTRFGAEKESMFSNLKEKSGSLIRDMKAKWVDSFSPIADAVSRAERKGLQIAETADPRLLRNRVLGANDIAKSMMSDRLEPTLKKVGVDNLDEFNKYLGARQAITVGDLGKETGIDSQAARTFVDTLAPKYEEAAKEVTSYTQQVLKYIQEGGLISEDVYKTLVERYPNYVPLNRIMNELEASGAIPARGPASLGSVQSVQKLKGSTRAIRNPLESIIDRTLQATSEVEVNRVASSLANLRNSDEFKDLIKPLNLYKEIQERISKTGKKFTTTVEKRETVPSNMGSISVFENGERKTYVVPKEIEEAAKNLNQQSMNIYLRALSIPTRLARLGITGINIPFIATNILKDAQFAILASDNAFRTSILNPFNFITSLLSTVGKGEAYRDFLRAGGGSSNFFSIGKEKAGLTVQELTSGKGRKVVKTITNPKKMLEFIEDTIGIAEQVSRVAAYRGTMLGEGGKIGLDVFAAPTRESLLAVRAGRETTVDFAKAGAYGRVLNLAYLYLNAGIQGSRTVARAFQQRPAATSMKVATTLYAPMVAAQLWNNATEERRAAWNDIPAYEKNNNLIILPPNPKLNDAGQYEGSIKLRIPDTFNALTVPLRFGIDKVLGNDEETVQNMLWETLSEASPVDLHVGSALPTALRGPAEVTANYDYFTGRAIVPGRRQELPPEDQVSINTSAFVKKIGQAIKYSPAKLQHLIKGYSGGVGLQVLNAVDRGMYLAGLIEKEEIGGEGLVASIQKRFTRVAGGVQEDKQFEQVGLLKQSDAKRREDEKKAAQKIYEELQAVPEEQWRGRLRELKNDSILNQRIYDRITVLSKDKASGITNGEKAIRELSVAERALWVRDQLVKVPKSERREYLRSLKEKKILSEAVFEEFKQLETKPEI